MPEKATDDRENCHSTVLKYFHIVRDVDKKKFYVKQKKNRAKRFWKNDFNPGDLTEIAATNYCVKVIVGERCKLLK